MWGVVPLVGGGCPPLAASPLLAPAPLLPPSPPASSGVAVALLSFAPPGAVPPPTRFLTFIGSTCVVTCITLFCGPFWPFFLCGALFFFWPAILLVLLGLVVFHVEHPLAFVCRLWYTCIAVGGCLVWPGCRVVRLPPVAFGSCRYVRFVRWLLWCPVSVLRLWSRRPDRLGGW